MCNMNSIQMLTRRFSICSAGIFFIFDEPSMLHGDNFSHRWNCQRLSQLNPGSIAHLATKDKRFRLQIRNPNPFVCPCLTCILGRMTRQKWLVHHSMDQLAMAWMIFFHLANLLALHLFHPCYKYYSKLHVSQIHWWTLGDHWFKSGPGD